MEKPAKSKSLAEAMREYAEKNGIPYTTVTIDTKDKEYVKRQKELIKFLKEKQKWEERSKKVNMSFKGRCHEGCAGGVITTSKNWPMDEMRYAYVK